MESKKRTAIVPQEGHYYLNKGGGTYKCLKSLEIPGDAIMQNIKSKWTLTAHGCGIYDDGTIDWDYSTKGYFEKEKKGR